MDNKTWLWRKRCSEKTIVATNESDFSSEVNEDEMIPTEKEVSLQRELENLNEKLASVLCDNDAKNDLIAIHAKMVEDAVAGQEKAEAAVVSLKKELDKALHQEIVLNERLVQLNAALKSSMQQLSSVREDQEQRMHDAVMKTSREFEKLQKNLEEKLNEKSKRIVNLTAENTHLSKALLVKEKTIEDLSKRKSQAEAEFNTLMARLDSIEKENAFLKYEFHMLERELEIRNEEIEYNRQSADITYKQHLESVKKIAKLEAECQRLRVLMRKRLPGPSALAKMKSDVEFLGKNQSEMRQSKLNSVTGSLVVKDTSLQNPSDISNKRINFLIERLCVVEEENKALKEILAKKEVELHSSQIVRAQTTSKLSDVEAQLGELSKGQTSMELVRCSPTSKDLSPTSSFGINNDEINHSESWASALISELEQFQNRKSKIPHELRTFGVSDMSLMDDFVEMEKLATVRVDSPVGTSCASSDANNALAISTKDSRGYHFDTRGKELVPLVQVQTSDVEMEIQTKCVSTGKDYNWLQNILKLILEESRISKRSFDDLLEDIKITLSYVKHSCANETKKEESLLDPGVSDPIPISGFITWKSPNASPSMGSLGGGPFGGSSVEEMSNQQIQSNLRTSVCKTIELIRRIDPACLKSVPDNGSEREGVNLACKVLPKPSDNLICVFQWKSSELSTVLRQFVSTCEDLLDGKAKFEKFAAELTSSLEWILSNCIISQDVLRVGEKTKKHLGLDKSSATGELGDGEDAHVPDGQSTHLHASLNSLSVMFEMEKTESDLREQNKGLKDELNNMESSQKELEARLQSANDKSEALMNQLWESEQTIGCLQMELKILRDSKGIVEDQIENQKLINEDLDTQLTVAKAKLNEVLQKLSTFEVELEDKSHCCEELEATCLELQLQLESVAHKEVPNNSIGQEGRLLQTGWEITAASAKLAECEQTILNLGKQLKALTPRNERSSFNKVISTTSITANNKKLNQRSSLRDQMLAEDGSRAENLRSSNTKEIISTVEAKKSSILLRDNLGALCSPSVLLTPPEAYLGLKPESQTAAVGSLALVPGKKRGGGFGLLRKLLMRRRRGGSNKKLSTVKK